MKRVLLILGHPNTETSFSKGAYDAYKKGAMESGAQIEELILADLDYDLSGKSCFMPDYPLTEDIKKAQEYITWAEHIVIFAPNWWGGTPGLFRGFFEAAFTKGFAYKYMPKSKRPVQLLKGRTANIIFNMNTPGIIYRVLFGYPAIIEKRNMLGFCGVKTKVTPIYGMIFKRQETLNKLIQKIYSMGKHLK